MAASNGNLQQRQMHLLSDTVHVARTRTRRGQHAWALAVAQSSRRFKALLAGVVPDLMLD